MADRVEDDDTYAGGATSGGPRLETVSTTTDAGEKTHKMKVVPVGPVEGARGAGLPTADVLGDKVLAELLLIRTCLQHLSGLNDIELGERLEG